MVKVRSVLQSAIIKLHVRINAFLCIFDTVNNFHAKANTSDDSWVLHFYDLLF